MSEGSWGSRLPPYSYSRARTAGGEICDENARCLRFRSHCSPSASRGTLMRVQAENGIQAVISVLRVSPYFTAYTCDFGIITTYVTPRAGLLYTYLHSAGLGNGPTSYREAGTMQSGQRPVDGRSCSYCTMLLFRPLLWGSPSHCLLATHSTTSPDHSEPLGNQRQRGPTVPQMDSLASWP